MAESLPCTPRGVPRGLPSAHPGAGALSELCPVRAAGPYLLELLFNPAQVPHGTRLRMSQAGSPQRASFQAQTSISGWHNIPCTSAPGAVFPQLLSHGF